MLRAVGPAVAFGVAIAAQAFAQSCQVPCDLGTGPDVEIGQIAENFGAASAPDSGALYMIGDYINAGVGNGDFGNNTINPFGVRSFKLAENNGAHLACRYYVNYSWFEGVGGASLLGRVVIGGERIVGDGATSIGAQIPMYFVDPIRNDLGLHTFGSTDTKNADVGDLVLIAKRQIFRSAQGDLVTAGAALQVPTGPSTIADMDTGGEQIESDHNGSLQPFIGTFYWLGEGFFIQYFLALDVPFDSKDATIMFNDLQFGHYMPTGRRRGITAITPSFELHVNNPLNNRVQTDPNAPFAMPVVYKDQVNVTTGLTLTFNQQTTLTLGLVVPIASIRTFDFELLAQLNMFGW